MTREQKMAKAVELRARGVILDEIAARLGVSRTTIVRWTDPDYAEKSRAVSQAWKDAHRDQNRARDRQVFQDAKVPCPRCGERHDLHYEVCQACRSADAAQRRETMQRLWAEGKTLVEIADALDSTRASISAEMTRWRKLGYEFPHRYRIAEGRRAA